MKRKNLQFVAPSLVLVSLLVVSLMDFPDGDTESTMLLVLVILLLGAVVTHLEKRHECDFTIGSLGSTPLLIPISQAGKRWASEHFDSPVQWGNGIILLEDEIDDVIREILRSNLVIDN